MRSTLFAAAVVAACSFSSPSEAAAVGLAKDIASGAVETSIELVRHGGPTCELGARGWHYHNRRGERIECSPRPRGYFHTWRCDGGRCGWWHRGYRRWH